MDVLKFYLYFNFLRDILILIQILFIAYLNFRKIKEDVESGLFFLFKFFLTFIIVFFLVSYLKTTFPEVRPISHYFPGLEENDSFPSRHTALSFSFSFLLLDLSLKYFILSFVISIFIAIFSLLSFSHWPLDILFGFLIGFIIAMISQELSYLFHRLYVHKFKPKT